MKRALVIGVLLLGAAGSLAVQLKSESSWWNRRALKLDPGSTSTSFVTGSSFVLLDHVGAFKAGEKGPRGYRAAVLDVKSGRLLANRVFDIDTRCWSASEARLWCKTTSDVELVEVPGLNTVRTLSDVLGARGQPLLDPILRADGGIEVLLTDGKAAHVDATTLAVSDADPKEVKTFQCDGADLGGPYARTDGGWLSLQGRKPARLVFDTNPYPGRDVPVPADAETFFRGGLDARFYQLGSEEFVVVAHQESDDFQSAAMLSRVDLETHKVAWRANLGPGEVWSVALSGGTVVAGLSGSGRRAVALDPATGKQRWEFSWAQPVTAR